MFIVHLLYYIHHINISIIFTIIIILLLIINQKNMYMNEYKQVYILRIHKDFILLVIN